MSKNISGFTIIEIVVVMTIIGVLSVIGAMSFSSVQTSVRDTQRSTQIGAISTALEAYYNKNG